MHIQNHERVQNFWFYPFRKKLKENPAAESNFEGPFGRSVSVGRYGRYGPVMTDSSRLQQHHTISDDPGQGCKAHEGGIRP